MYDTVDSSTEVDSKDLAVDPSFVGQTSHLIAADEKRATFAAQSVLDPSRPVPDNVNEIVVRGVHANIGGGNANGEQGKSNALSARYLQWMIEEAERAGVPTFKPRNQDDLEKLEQIRNLSDADLDNYIHEPREGFFAPAKWFGSDSRVVNYPSNKSSRKFTTRELQEQAKRDRNGERIVEESDQAGVEVSRSEKTERDMVPAYE